MYGQTDEVSFSAEDKGKRLQPDQIKIPWFGHILDGVRNLHQKSPSVIENNVSPKNRMLYNCINDIPTTENIIKYLKRSEYPRQKIRPLS